MKPLVVAVQAIVGIALMVGCAAPGVPQPEVKPVLAVHDGGATADHYYQLGRYHQSKERHKDAAQAYRKAISIDPTLAEAHNALAAIHATDRDLDLAITELNTAIALDPSAPHFRNNLGYAYYLQGRLDEAIASFEQAAARDPANPRVWNNMGLALSRRGDVGQAAAAFARANAVAAGAPALARSDPPIQPAVEPSRTPAFVVLERIEPATATELTSALAAPISAPVFVLAIEANDEMRPSLESMQAGELWPRATVESLHVPEAARPPLQRFVSESAPADAPATTQPAPATVQPVPAGPVASLGQWRLEVSNGNGVNGMARKVAGALRTAGLPRALLTNQKPFAQRFTEVQYREGYAAAAVSLSARLRNQPLSIRSDRLRANVDVRIVLGGDVAAGVTLRDPQRLAANVE